MKDVDGSVLVPATDPCRIGLEAPLLILGGQSHVRDMNPMVKSGIGSGQHVVHREDVFQIRL